MVHFADNRPVTEARLPSALEIQLMTPVKINLPMGSAWQAQPGITIGTISRMSRTQTRDVKRRYSLGTYAYEPYDIIPGPITTTLTLEKVVFYSEKLILSDQGYFETDGDMLGLFGYVSGSLLFQQSPFSIQEIVHPPPGRAGNPTVTSYLDCWFTTNPIAYDIMDSNQLIVQECEVAVGRVQVAIPPEKAAAPLVKSLLPSSISLG